MESLYPTIEMIFRFKKGFSLGKLFTKNFKGKDPSEIGVIYKLCCNKYSKVYIGQTKLNIKERMKRHKDALQKPGSSSAADHMVNYRHHTIDFSSPLILARDIS